VIVDPAATYAPSPIRRAPPNALQKQDVFDKDLLPILIWRKFMETVRVFAG